MAASSSALFLPTYNVLSHAQKLLSWGWIPVPIAPPKLLSDGSVDPRSGKAPWGRAWQETTAKDAVSRIQAACRSCGVPALNLGVLCGEKSRVVVLDVDAKDDPNGAILNGLACWNDLIAEHGEPQTFKVRSGGGGLHYYLCCDELTHDMTSGSHVVTIGGKKAGIDLRAGSKKNGGWGQVLAPGSVHPVTGRRYEVVGGMDNGVPVVNPMPAWLVRLLFGSFAPSTDMLLLRKALIRSEQADELNAEWSNMDPDGDDAQRWTDSFEAARQAGTDAGDGSSWPFGEMSPEALREFFLDRRTRELAEAEAGAELDPASSEPAEEETSAAAVESDNAPAPPQRPAAPTPTQHPAAPTPRRPRTQAGPSPEGSSAPVSQPQAKRTRPRRRGRSQFDMLVQLVQRLSAARATVYDNWVRVIWALKHESDADDTHSEAEYRELAHTFSRRAANYDAAAVDRKWSEPRQANCKAVTVGTLLFFLEQDIGAEACRAFKMQFAPTKLEELGEEGLGKLLAQLLAGRAFSSSMTARATVYMYDETKALWLEGTIENLVVMAGALLADRIGGRVATGVLGEKINLTSRRIRKNLSEEALAGLADPAQVERLDSADSLLPVKGGLVVDLATGEARERTLEDRFTREIPVAYDPDVDTSSVERYMLSLMCGDVEMTRFLQKVLGYSLIGGNPEQRIFLCWGRGQGRNGKSKLFELLSLVLGSFFIEADKSVFIATESHHSGSEASPYVAELRGKRLAVFSETDRGDHWNEGKVKTLVGNDRLKGRPLYGDPIEFVPKLKPFVLTNFKPECSSDEAFWRRMVLIPFTARFVPNPVAAGEYKQDDGVIAALKTPAGLSALLKWLVCGARVYYTEKAAGRGFELAAKVETATKEYQEESDKVGRFLAECTVAGTREEKIPPGDLYARYELWCLAQGEQPMTKQLWGREMSSRLQATKSNGAKFYVGIHLL